MREPPARARCRPAGDGCWKTCVDAAGIKGVVETLQESRFVPVALPLKPLEKIDLGDLAAETKVGSEDPVALLQRKGTPEVREEKWKN